MRYFEEQVRSDPAVRTVDAFAGALGRGGNAGSLFLELEPLGERKVSADEVIARIRRKTAAQDIRIGGRQSNAQYQYTLQTQDLPQLALWGPRVLDRLMQLPELVDVSSDQQNSGLSSNVVIDRDTASRLGLTAQSVDSALNDAFGQRQVSVMYKSINQYHVVEALLQKWWQSPNVLTNIYIQTPVGLSIPLSTFTHFNEGKTPLSVPHQGQFPATTISFNLPEGVALSDAEAAIAKAQLELGMAATIVANSRAQRRRFRLRSMTSPF
jgi:multidrug efflux pump